MARSPVWFRQLNWSAPRNVAVVNTDRSVIPPHPGCYAFTTHNQALSPNRVLYVGSATVSLRERLAVYLIKEITVLPPLPNGERRRFHKGKAYVLEARQKRGDQGVFLRWAEYGAGPEHVLDLEASLIDYLRPRCNERDESLRRPIFGEWESLIPNAY